MHLVLCPDETYAQHAAVVLASVLGNVSQPRSLTVWIVANGLGPSSRRMLARVGRRAGARIEFLTVDAGRLKGSPLGGHISLASYYRLLVPGHLPAEVERFLYLDSDVVVEEDIAPLFATELGGNAIAAVVNPCNWHAQLGLPSDTRYFNAGVMLVDRGRWAAGRVTERVLAVIAEKPETLRYWDQDALNIVIAGAWTALEPAWNQQNYFPILDPKRLGCEPEAWKRALERPALIHFTTAAKPWHAKCRHPFSSRYHHYRRRAGLYPLWLRPRHLIEILRRKFFVRARDPAGARERGGAAVERRGLRG